jgi:pseudoazurin
MNKKNAILVAVILAAITVFVVVASMSVMVDDSKERYGELSAPTEVQEEVSEAAAQIETDAVEEALSEEIEEAGASIEEIVEEATATTEEAMSNTAEQAEEMLADAETAVATVADDVEEKVEAVTQVVTGGQVHIVTAQGLKYEPLVIKIQPGDTVAWENMPTHDTQSIEGLIPEGAEAWHSQMGVNYQRTFTVEGIYVYKCTPHIGAGMGGAIIVGNPVNLAAIIAADAKGAEGRLAKKAIAEAQAM